MFGNFIYFIVALLIYATYQPAEAVGLDLYEVLPLTLGFMVAFAVFTHHAFARLAKRALYEHAYQVDQRYHAILTRQSILAIALFALNIYALNLPSFFADITLFKLFPTLLALCFLCLFVFYLTIVWGSAHRAHERLHPSGMTRGAFIFSNISFAIPVILPWLLLSTAADLIFALPFELPKRWLATTQGEILFFMTFLFGIAIAGPALIQRFWGCRPLEAGFFRNRIEQLCQLAGLQYANILYWPIFGGRMITAGVMGLVRRFRYILVTDALLRYLEPDELDAVIAHEIGHVKKKHLLFYLFFFAGYLLITFAADDLILLGVIYARPFYQFFVRSGVDAAGVTAFVRSLAIIGLFLIYFRFVFGFFMRNFERQADGYVFALFDSAKPLISTLKKIAITSGQAPDRPNWHHFSIAERINYLERCEADRSWIRRQDSKIRKSIALYVVGVLLVGIGGYHYHYGGTREKWSLSLIEKVLLREIEKTPADADLYASLGDVYYSGKKYPETIEAYRQALALKPENPQVLNNLAWLLATCEDARHRNPQQALPLALEAARLEKSPQILDTLAESYHVNERHAQAVAAARQALQQATSNREYYQKQLAKFKSAAGGGAEQ